MAIQIIHVSDIHFGSGESHGRINPDTGLNTRLEDFVKQMTAEVGEKTGPASSPSAPVKAKMEARL